MAQVVCAGWAGADGHHPCGLVLGQTSGDSVSHGACPSCFRRQLEGYFPPERIQQLLEQAALPGKEK
jgi:hypothetical protein